MAKTVKKEKPSYHHYLPHLGEERALSHHVRKIQQFSTLKADEEFELAKKWHQHKDPKVAEKLIKSHLRLVHKIALGYRGYGMAIQDLIAEGHIGMMQAVNRFDPAKGFRFSTYAMWWIHAAIKDYILRSWSLVRTGTTSAQKKLFFSLRLLKNKLTGGTEELSEEQIQHIAETLEVPSEEVAAMEQRLRGRDASLNAQVSGLGEGEWVDWLEDEEQDHEKELLHLDELEKRKKMLENAFECLNKRELEIFKGRRLEEPPKTLEELAQILDISRERVRQIEMGVFQKIQKEVRARAKRAGILNAFYWLPF